ncbi:hypothetical protein JTB14_015930 [Gonioctena quinquepunctata]|nr:hypothetical protein JTB14_015930 [Gonioctena quinquepunctata]
MQYQEESFFGDLDEDNCEEPVESKQAEIDNKPCQSSDFVEHVEPESATKDGENVYLDDKDSSKTESVIKHDKEELKSAKEKQCWNMYCKMTEKGINISFDTILRGMLTPTEYRLSKKHLDEVPNNESTGGTNYQKFAE